MTADLRLGDYRAALADVASVDALICDPPYGERTHTGNSDMRRFVGAPKLKKADGTTRTCAAARSNLSYGRWTAADVHEFVAFWAPRCKGWMACMTSDDLIAVWREAYATAGRLDFAPVPCIQHRPRLGGDGPGSGTVYLMVARPKRKAFLAWGSLPCFYGPLMAPSNKTSNHIGGKPLSWMREIVRDYSNPGDLVCDPCAGAATTAVAALQEGRRFVGSECSAATYRKAVARLAGTVMAPPLLHVPRGGQPELFS